MWSEGDTILRREVLNDGRSWAEVDVLVVRDEPELLATYIAEGTPFVFPEGDWPIEGGRHPWAGRGYVNLQEAFRRTAEGYDTQDHELDIWIPAGGTWQLKDDELLDVRVREGRFTQDQANAFRAEAARITAELDAGRRWWDDGWAAWQPELGRQAPSRAAGTTAIPSERR